MNFWSELKAVGTFRGVIEGQIDTFEFSIPAWHYLDGTPAQWTDGGDIDFYRENFHNDGDSIEFLENPSFTNHQFNFDLFSGPAEGIMQIDMDSVSVRMEYTWEDGNEYILNGVVIA